MRENGLAREGLLAPGITGLVPVAPPIAYVGPRRVPACQGYQDPAAAPP